MVTLMTMIAVSSLYNAYARSYRCYGNIGSLKAGRRSIYQQSFRRFEPSWRLIYTSAVRDPRDLYQRQDRVYVCLYSKCIPAIWDVISFLEFRLTIYDVLMMIKSFCFGTLTIPPSTEGFHGKYFIRFVSYVFIILFLQLRLVKYRCRYC